MNGATCETPRKGIRGFSLIEVNLAILLVGVGLFSLFALFPRALRESDMAIADTHEAMFGASMLSAIEGNASDITDWDEWTDMALLSARLSEGMMMQNINLEQVSGGLEAASVDLEFPEDSGRYVTYKLQILPRGQSGGKLIDVGLKISSGRNRTMSFARDYITTLIYKGE